jgi:hypothetical protein
MVHHRETGLDRGGGGQGGLKKRANEREKNWGGGVREIIVKFEG